jgi:hypothetical protein
VTNWPSDFHNEFYRDMANTNPRGAFTDAWWAGFLPVLRAWRATRPRGSDFLTARARERFSILTQTWARDVEPNLDGDIASVEWSQVRVFPALVAEIKDVESPVFASKFRHFLAPAVFPVVDNAAMGNPFPTYAACFNAYRREWLSTESATRDLLTTQLAYRIGAPLACAFPIKNKVIELCLIGRNHRRRALRQASVSRVKVYGAL